MPTINIGSTPTSPYTWVTATFAWNSAEATAKAWATAFAATAWTLGVTEDVASWAEALANTAGLNTSEAWATAEALVRAIGLNKPEAWANVEALAKAADISLADAFATAEALSNNVGLNKPEAWANAEALANAVGINPAEAFLTAEGFGRVWTIDRQIAEAWATAESLANAVGLNKSETAAVAEALSNETGKGLSDAWANAEGLTYATGKGVAEGWGNTETLTNATGKAVAEAFLTSEGFDRTWTIDRQFAEAFRFEQGIRWADATFAWNDLTYGALTWAGTDTHFEIYRQLAIALAETFHVADAISNIMAYALAASESFNVAEALKHNAGKALADAWANSDAVSNATGKSLSDAWGNTDALARDFGLGKSEALAVAEALGNAAGKSIGEAWANADALTHDTGKVISETFSILDALANTVQFIRDFSETAAIAEALSKGADKALAESWSQGDAIGNVSAFVRGFSENLLFAEDFARVVVYQKALSDGWSTTDSIAKAQGISLTEALSVVDEYKKKAAAVLSDIAIKTGDMSQVEFTALMASAQPAGYGAFKAFMPGDYEYAAAIWKVILESDGLERGRIGSLNVSVDVPDVEDRGLSSVSIGTSVINFNRVFHEPPEVNCSMKGGAVFARPKILAITKTGFTVGIYNSADALVAGDISWIAIGY